MIPQRMQMIKELLEKEPTDSFLNYALALEYDKENNTEKAIAIIEHIVLSDPEYLASYYQLGKLYEKLNDLNKAIFSYKKGIEIAQKQKNRKALNELNEALFLMEE